jgi:FtsH-binding integral membrane protein
MYESETSAVSAAQVKALEQAFVTKVFIWMTWGLLITGVVAAVVANYKPLNEAIFGNMGVFWGLAIGELALVWVISAGINRLSAATASGLFIVYSALNGLTLSWIFLVYTQASITSTFFVTAGMFGTMAIFGYVTKKDLSSLGGFLLMALVGLIIASVVNLFLGNAKLYWLITYAGIFIFVGLTAYDMQKIRGMSRFAMEGAEVAQKAAIMGALALYLDFINLFILLLRLMGRRK